MDGRLRLGRDANLSVSADYWAIKLEDMIVDVGADEVLASEAGCLTGKNIDGTPWANPAGGDYCAGILARVNRDSNGAWCRSSAAVQPGQPRSAWRRPDRALPSGDRAMGQLPAGCELHQPDLHQEQRYANDPNPERRDRDLRSKLRASLAWQRGGWNTNVYADRVGSVPGVRYHWGTDRLDNPGGCLPFADGYVPSDRPSLNAWSRQRVRMARRTRTPMPGSGRRATTVEWGRSSPGTSTWATR